MFALEQRPVSFCTSPGSNAVRQLCLSASADDSLSGEVGSQHLYAVVDEDDADARHLLGPLLDDLSDGGPSTNRRGYVGRGPGASCPSSSRA